jgi:hypothetical protein
MAEEPKPPRMTEPVTVPCLFCSGVEIEMGPTFVRIVGFVDLETVEYSPPERRIIARVVLPSDTARELLRSLRKQLNQGHH